MSVAKLFWLLVTLPSCFARPDAQRSPIDAGVRGNSFGLENFLFQSYDNPETTTVRVVKTKRVRPAATLRVPTSGQVYGLENLTPTLYESNRIKTAKPEHSKRRPEPTADSTRIKENFIVRPEPVEATLEPETPPQETRTERIRKRIMMRRRRKRPPNGVQSEGNVEVTGNAILKPVRIPVHPKVVVRTQLPDHTIDRLPPMGVKSATQPEKDSAERAIEEESTTVSEKTTTTTTTTEKPINLKAFLKQQTETLSLSELLQTQNLSLADLLRGNKDASAILRARQQSTTTVTSVKRKQIERTEPEETSKVETVETTTPRVVYNGFQPKIPRTKINEQIKPTEETGEDTAKPKRQPAPVETSAVDPLNRLNELRLKLRNFQKKNSPEPSRIPPKEEVVETVSTPSTPPKVTEPPLYKKNRVPFRSSNNPEISVILPSKVKPESEAPKRFTNWTNRSPTKKITSTERPKQNEVTSKPLRTPIVIEGDNKSVEVKEENATEVAEESEEVRKPEPKDELIELLKSGQNADRLQKILQSRNMTIQELLDNREKPPLQMNISTLFSSQQKPASTQPTLFDSLPDFEAEETDPSLPVYDDPEPEESAPVIAKVQLLPGREGKQFDFPVSEKGVSQSLQPDDPPDGTPDAEDSALWKLSENSVYYGSSYGYGEFAATKSTEKPKMTTELTEEDIILLETIRRNQETSRKFKLNYKDFIREEEQPEPEDIEKSYIPPAVKSAIIASGVVMGIALFVFIAIFAACGWKQRQIRLKGSSNGLGGTLGKREKSKRTLSPASFKDSHSYKKTIDFDDETSESGSSNTSSYLWSTLKNTFTSRASTLKSRLEKEEKMREDKVTLRRNESRRKESRLDDRQIGDETYTVKKIDRDRNVINTSFNFKRSLSNNNVNHFNECVHGY